MSKNRALLRVDGPGLNRIAEIEVVNACPSCPFNYHDMNYANSYCYLMDHVMETPHGPAPDWCRLREMPRVVMLKTDE